MVIAQLVGNFSGTWFLLEINKKFQILHQINELTTQLVKPNFLQHIFFFTKMKKAVYLLIHKNIQISIIYHVFSIPQT